MAFSFIDVLEKVSGSSNPLSSFVIFHKATGVPVCVFFFIYPKSNIFFLVEGCCRFFRRTE